MHYWAMGYSPVSLLGIPKSINFYLALAQNPCFWPMAEIPYTFPWLHTRPTARNPSRCIFYGPYGTQIVCSYVQIINTNV